MEIENFFHCDEPLKSYMRLVQYVLTCSNEYRERIHNQWDGKLDWKYPQSIIPSQKLTYSSESSAEKELSSVERAQAILVCDWFENGSCDFRDALVGWAIVYHELLVVHERPRNLFKRVGLILGGEVGEQLIQFSMRQDADLGMEKFGLRYIRDPDGQVVKVVFG